MTVSALPIPWPHRSPGRGEHAADSAGAQEQRCEKRFEDQDAAAAPKVRPLFRLTVRMLLPLPGSSGNQTEQTPITSPAAAIDGISSQEFSCGRACAGHEVIESQSHRAPAATARARKPSADRTNGCRARPAVGVMGDQRGGGDGEAGGDQCGADHPRVPRLQHNARGEQRATQRNAVDRSQSRAGRAREQDLAVSGRQGPPGYAEITYGGCQLAGRAFTAQ